MFKSRLLIITGLIISLTGCSWIPKSAFTANRDKNYLYAKSIPPMKIPPGVSSDKMESYYPVPDKNYPAPTSVMNPKPPGLN